MNKVKIITEYITLGQLLKFVGIIRNGAEAKSYLLTAEVIINGENDNRRGRKLYQNDLVLINKQEYLIIK